MSEPCMYDAPCVECESERCDYWCDDTQEVRAFNIEEDE